MYIKKDSSISYRSNASHNNCNHLGVINVNSYKLSEVNKKNLTTTNKSNLDSYHTQCDMPNHDGCLGHICKLDNGNLLFPGSMCNVIGNISDQKYKIGIEVMKNTIVYKEYCSKLESMMTSKKGILRGKCLSGVVSGSLRMVILPSWDLEINEIYIPKYVTNTLIIPSRNTNGKDSIIIKYEKVEEGDYAIVVRPPTLTESSIQPMRVKFWNRGAIGLSPNNCNEYHADFDGDEMQVYFLKSKRSIEECKSWGMLTTSAFDYKGIEEELGNKYNKRTFMESTTISLRQALSGVKITKTMKASKIKQESFNMIKQQLNMSLDEFVDLSEKGIHDIMRQQLYQGEVGRISRSARAGCIDFISHGYYNEKISSDTAREVKNYPLSEHITLSTLAGFPACVLVSRICAVIQQSYLDSHRAKLSSVARFDIASSFITGEGDNIYISNDNEGSIWSAITKIDNREVYICQGNINSKVDHSEIIGCYSSKMLSYIDENKRYDVAFKGIKFLLNYYSILFNELELSTLAYVISHDCRKGINVPTTSDGIGKRNYRWLTKLVAQHWICIHFYTNELDIKYNVDTRAEASVFGNFSNIPSVLYQMKAGFNSKST